MRARADDRRTDVELDCATPRSARGYERHARPAKPRRDKKKSPDSLGLLGNKAYCFCVSKKRIRAVIRRRYAGSSAKRTFRFSMAMTVLYSGCVNGSVGKDAIASMIAMSSSNTSPNATNPESHSG